jgi:hypothetical protein
MITSVVRQKNPVANRCTERKEQERQGMLPFGIYAPDCPAAILSLSFKNATPPVLPRGARFPVDQAALYTVPVQLPGHFPEGIAKISDPVLLLRRQNSKKYNSKSGAL